MKVPTNINKKRIVKRERERKQAQQIRSASDSETENKHTTCSDLLAGGSIFWYESPQ